MPWCLLSSTCLTYLLATCLTYLLACRMLATSRTAIDADLSGATSAADARGEDNGGALVMALAWSNWLLPNWLAKAAETYMLWLLDLCVYMASHLPAWLSDPVLNSMRTLMVSITSISDLTLALDAQQMGDYLATGLPLLCTAGIPLMLCSHIVLDVRDACALTCMG